MKKIIFLLLAAACCGGHATVHAQTSDKAFLLNIHTLETDAGAVRATRDFWKRAGDGKEEKWSRLPEGYLAEYTDGGVGNRWLYDQRGNWVYSILFYGEKELPAEVRHLVR